MLFMLIGVCVIIIILGILVDKFFEWNWEDVQTLSAVVAGALVIPVIFAVVEVSEASVLEEKIVMYEEENQHIEDSISIIINNYQNYETGIFKDVADSNSDSSIALVSMYPELKSDALVQEQLSIYIANNEKIKELKEQQINASVWRWWLYFGK